MPALLSSTRSRQNSPTPVLTSPNPVKTWADRFALRYGTPLILNTMPPEGTTVVLKVASEAPSTARTGWLMT